MSKFKPSKSASLSRLDNKQWQPKSNGHNQNQGHFQWFSIHVIVFFLSKEPYVVCWEKATRPDVCALSQRAICSVCSYLHYTGPSRKAKREPRPLAAAAYCVMIRILWGQGRHVRRKGHRVTTSCNCRQQPHRLVSLKRKCVKLAALYGLRYPSNEMDISADGEAEELRWVFPWSRG